MTHRIGFHNLSALGVLLICATVGLSQTVERDTEKERLIWDKLQKAAPKTLDTFKKATEALDRDDYVESARLYSEVLKKAPEFDPALRRRGISLAESGNVAEGVLCLEKAVKIKASPENLITLAQCLAFPGGGINAPTADKERAFTLAKQAYSAAPDETDPSYAILVAQLALTLNRDEELRAVVGVLKKDYPNIAATCYFAAVLASFDRDWITAENEMKKAVSLGLPYEMAGGLIVVGGRSETRIWHYAFYSLYSLGAWAVGLALLFVLGKYLSNATLRFLENSDPNAPTVNRELSLRRFYRYLINIAGLYYYLSIPVVVLLVIVIAGSLVYGSLVVRHVPIKLVLFIIFAALVTVYAMIRSLFIRIIPEDPGRSLRRDEAPGLWAMVEEVACEVGTRPVDEIRITPFTDLAVYEKGSFKERMQDKARRLLVLGTGVLNDFTQDSFRAVLAHEYGHFSNRDTAGGDVALRVRSDMIKFAHAMAASGQAAPWNIAFQFLRIYDFIFRRISHGATRLQEVLADRVAARTYGPAAFEAGLRHVVRRQVEFEDIAYWGIVNAAKSKLPLQNLYESRPSDQKRIEEKIADEISRESSDDDTHPSPTYRFMLAHRIISGARPPSPGMVWDLFSDKQNLMTEMNSFIEKHSKADA